MATYYVEWDEAHAYGNNSDGWTDPGAGTDISPFKKLKTAAAAINALPEIDRPGSIIKAKGIFREYNTLSTSPFTADGQPDDPIILEQWDAPFVVEGGFRYPTELTTYDKVGTQYLLAIRGNHWLLRDFEVRNGRDGQGVYFRRQTTGSSEGNICSGLHVHHISQGGIHFRSSTGNYDNIVENCYLHDNHDIQYGGHNADGIKDPTCRGLIVRNNVFLRNSDDSLDLISPPSGDFNRLVEGNVFLYPGYFDGNWWTKAWYIALHGEAVYEPYFDSPEIGLYMVRSDVIRAATGLGGSGTHIKDGPGTTYRQNFFGKSKSTTLAPAEDRIAAQYRNTVFDNNTCGDTGQVTLRGEKAIVRNNILYETNRNIGGGATELTNNWNLSVTPIAAHFLSTALPTKANNAIMESYDGTTPIHLSVDDFDSAGYFHLDPEYS
jgi:hypothetical protein